MCNRLKLVETPAKRIPDKSRQDKINQSQHTEVLADLPPELVFVVPNTGANRKRMIFFVKHVSTSPGNVDQQGFDGFTALEFDRSKEITMSLLR